MIDTYESLNERFPIIDVVIKHLTCNDTEKKLIRDLLVTVYGVGYNDGTADGVNKMQDGKRTAILR